jgi:hypothetical protein
MIRDTPPPTDEVLQTVAELRAGGSSWETVAKKLGHDVATVRSWAEADPARWRKASRAALRAVITDGFAEAALAFRRQLRSDDEKTVRDAAGWFFRLQMTLIRHRPKVVKAGTTPAAAAAEPPDPFAEFGVSSWEEYDEAAEKMMHTALDQIAARRSAKARSAGVTEAPDPTAGTTRSAARRTSFTPVGRHLGEQDQPRNEAPEHTGEQHADGQPANEPEFRDPDDHPGAGSGQGQDRGRGGDSPVRVVHSTEGPGQEVKHPDPPDGPGGDGRGGHAPGGVRVVASVIPQEPRPDDGGQCPEHRPGHDPVPPSGGVPPASLAFVAPTLFPHPLDERRVHPPALARQPLGAELGRADQQPEVVPVDHDDPDPGLDRLPLGAGVVPGALDPDAPLRAEQRLGHPTVTNVNGHANSLT